LMMMISATFDGGGFAKTGMWHALGVETAIFPISTFIGSTYDRSLFAGAAGEKAVPGIRG